MMGHEQQNGNNVRTESMIQLLHASSLPRSHLHLDLRHWSQAVGYQGQEHVGQGLEW